MAPTVGTTKPSENRVMRNTNRNAKIVPGTIITTVAMADWPNSAKSMIFTISRVTSSINTICTAMIHIGGDRLTFHWSITAEPGNLPCSAMPPRQISPPKSPAVKAALNELPYPAEGIWASIPPIRRKMAYTMTDRKNTTLTIKKACENDIGCISK